jgi:hypothetical protein
MASPYLFQYVSEKLQQSAVLFTDMKIPVRSAPLPPSSNQNMSLHHSTWHDWGDWCVSNFCLRVCV